jgi:hypothetical protein
MFASPPFTFYIQMRGGEGQGEWKTFLFFVVACYICPREGALLDKTAKQANQLADN